MTDQKFQLTFSSHQFFQLKNQDNILLEQVLERLIQSNVSFNQSLEDTTSSIHENTTSILKIWISNKKIEKSSPF